MTNKKVKKALKDLTKSQLLERAKKLQRETGDLTCLSKLTKSKLIAYIKRMKRLGDKLAKSKMEACLRVSQDTVERLRKKIAEMQGRRFSVGDVVTLDSPIANYTGNDTPYKIAAVLEEANGMRRYFLEGVSSPVEGRHLQLFSMERSITFHLDDGNEYRADVKYTCNLTNGCDEKPAKG